MGDSDRLMAPISPAFIIQPNLDVSANVAVVALILGKADILIWKIIFHHFLMTGKVREMECCVPHGRQ